MSNIIIREAEAADYHSVAALYTDMLASLAERFPADYKPEGAIASLKQQTFINALDNEDWAFLVAEADNALVGVIQISREEDTDNEYRHPQTRIWIEELIVAEGSELEEVATQLIEAAEQWAAELEVTTLDFIIYHFNDRLLKLCHSLGYEVFSTRVRKQITK